MPMRQCPDKRHYIRPDLRQGLPRPFLFLGSQAMHSPGGKDTTWERDWAHLTGWKRWLVVAGAEHASFTDTGLLVEQLGVYRNPDLSGARAVGPRGGDHR